MLSYGVIVAWHEAWHGISRMNGLRNWIWLEERRLLFSYCSQSICMGMRWNTELQRRDLLKETSFKTALEVKKAHRSEVDGERKERWTFCFPEHYRISPLPSRPTPRRAWHSFAFITRRGALDASGRSNGRVRFGFYRSGLAIAISFIMPFFHCALCDSNAGCGTSRDPGIRKCVNCVTAQGHCKTCTI